MNYRRGSITTLTIGFFCGLSLPLAFAQLTPEEIDKREYWEDFLANAEIVKAKKIRGNAVTKPLKLTLQEGDVVASGCWKKVRGRNQGATEGWQWEVAAYLLDKHLGLNMVPPVVPREYKHRTGSLCLWVENEMTLMEKVDNKVVVPPDKLDHWNKQIYKQRLFDNLIGNVDRNQGNLLITKDWRVYLIDHSRTFGTSDKYDRKLQFCEEHRHGPRVMEKIPRTLYEKVRDLTDDILARVVGDHLTKTERRKTLKRRDLIVAEIERLIAEKGANRILY